MWISPDRARSLGSFSTTARRPGCGHALGGSALASQRRLVWHCSGRSRTAPEEEAARAGQHAMDEAPQAMFDWVSSAPPAELAAELMAAFGPSGPRGGNGLEAPDLVKWLFREYPGIPSKTLIGLPPADERADNGGRTAVNMPNWSLNPGHRWRIAVGVAPVWVGRPSPAGRPLSGSASRIGPACSHLRRVVFPKQALQFAYESSICPCRCDRKVSRYQQGKFSPRPAVAGRNPQFHTCRTSPP